MDENSKKVIDSNINIVEQQIFTFKLKYYERITVFKENKRKKRVLPMVTCSLGNFFSNLTTKAIKVILKHCVSQEDKCQQKCKRTI